MEDLLDSNTTHNKPLVQERLPNSGGIIAMGIISIVFSMGLIGLILSIITLSLASKSLQLYRDNPDNYLESSYKQVKSGRTCAIVSLSLFGLAILIAIVFVAANS